MKLYIRNEEMLKYLYPELCDHAIEMGKVHKLTNEQVNVYNFLCRKDFYLTNYSGDNFFNPESEYGTDTTWMNKIMKKLIKKGLVDVFKSPVDMDRRFKMNYFFMAGTKLSYLVDGGCPVANTIMRKIKTALELRDGWLSNGPCDINGISMTEDGMGFKYFSYDGYTAQGDFSTETALHNLYFDLKNDRVKLVKK